MVPKIHDKTIRMTIEYHIDENDYLTFQLFTASKSAVIIKRRFRTRILFPALYLIIGGVLLTENNIQLSVAFFALALVWFFLYPIRDRRIYKANYQNYIRRNYKDAFGKPATIRFEDKYFIAKDSVSETRFAHTEIEEITEIPVALYVKMKSGQTFILPKDKVKNSETWIVQLQEIASKWNVVYSSMPDWKWK